MFLSQKSLLCRHWVLDWDVSVTHLNPVKWLIPCYSRNSDFSRTENATLANQRYVEIWNVLGKQSAHCSTVMIRHPNFHKIISTGGFFLCGEGYTMMVFGWQMLSNDWHIYIWTKMYWKVPSKITFPPNAVTLQSDDKLCSIMLLWICDPEYFHTKEKMILLLNGELSIWKLRIKSLIFVVEVFLCREGRREGKKGRGTSRNVN